MNIEQLNYFFQAFRANAPDTVLIAAAGNDVQYLTLPAVFDKVIAVGSFDYDAVSPISAFYRVPANRYVLAPGGRGAAGAAYGQRETFAEPEFLHGTSFAAAFVSAFAAKVICARKGGRGTPLKGQLSNPLPEVYAVVLAEIAARSDTTWLGFESARHGLGAIRF
jgi:subtilisin family serine protease